AGERVGEAIGSFMEAFEEELRSFRRLLPAWVPTRGRRRIAEARRSISGVLDPIIARERASGEERDHLLGRLLAARDEDGEGMSDAQLRDEAITLFTAGHETTSIALSYALWLLAHHPSIQEEVAAEGRAVSGDRPPSAADLSRLPLHRAVIRESMRLYPPAWMIGRAPTEDVQIGGHVVRAGEQILMPQWVVHRDPRWWREPLAFRPERWLGDETEGLPRFAYFPFGGGPRVCIGNHFATLEAVLILAVWLKHHRLTAAPGATLEPMPAVTLRPRSGVWLEHTAR
ncbi:MAG TPA: cytochrome P450, partial [Deltaproteobacteria bacterium]|nr:cytochrome P450 [Deltaproteobacteria bacterium]